MRSGLFSTTRGFPPRRSATTLLKAEGEAADGSTVGSRLGTHAIWTLTLSVAITLLALSPIVLPSGTQLGRLPSPLAGVEQIGRVVVSALKPPAEKRESAKPPQAAPPVSAASAPETASESGFAGLPEPAPNDRAEPQPERPDRPARPKKPAPAVSPRDRPPTKSEAKAEHRAERAQAKAERKEDRAEQHEEKKDKGDKKEKPKEKGHGSGDGKNSDQAHDKGGKRHA
jgi:hypothetical protein